MKIKDIKLPKMAKFHNIIQQYVVRFGDKFMLVKGNKAEWIDNLQEANKYASKYAAKDHLRRLTNVPESVEYELLN